MPYGALQYPVLFSATLLFFCQESLFSHQTLSVPTDGVLNGHFASMDATITHITIWQSASYIFVLSGLTDKFFIVFFFIVLQRELF